MITLQSYYSEVYKGFNANNGQFTRQIQFNSCVSRYQVYQDRWLPLQGEMLASQCEEDSNVYDPFAVKLVKPRVIVGHVPRRISSTCSLFLRHRVAITY